jgi:hypothetical protein
MKNDPSPDEIAAIIGQLNLIPIEEKPALSENEKARRKQARKRKFKIDKIALLDFETDPFDSDLPDELIEPFVVALYSDDFEHVIWDDDFNSLIDKIFVFIESLDEPYIFYAHNGGRFDYRFMEHKLRGQVNYKGSSLMRATIGNCEIRDSSHILPIRLSQYNKEKFDYEKMRKCNRHKHRAEIISYVVSDCKNTLDLIKKFVEKNGFKISIGAAALAAVRKDYDIESVAAWTDDLLRPYFRGGRVECISGLGYFEGDFKYYDVNSMYPDVMANMKHPIGSEYVFRDGKPNGNTFFLKIECDNNGALLQYDDEKCELTSEIEHGVFNTTIHEYHMALELGLIENVRFLECVDNYKITDFSKFVIPHYRERQQTKKRLAQLQEGTPEYLDTFAADLLIKLELNNAYGKTAQNPRRFKQFLFTEPGEMPDAEKEGEGWELQLQNAVYWVWQRPSPDTKFLNVGTGASITGGARSKLMQAIHYAKNPLYCDTDSLICEDLPGLELHNENLGAWKIEAEVSKLIVAGKKLYAYETKDGKQKFRSKGTSNWTWDEMLKLLVGENVIKINPAPTLTRGGGQVYVSRSVRATARAKPRLSSRLKGKPSNDALAKS